ncbi:MAG TPA: imidazole glycerol phosphate synthase cyclase subunit, partial [Anaeromyxobacteraceae bacterium]|nr:imidazole glycerol phosphate synthase cyclase subunit [Anaeromyxobacteraceae bacterium]
MPAKRIIPCLDVKNGRVVKGIKFQNLRDAGDPVEAAARYDEQGADEVTYLDIAATQENRGTLIDLVTRTAARVFAPLTVGGGVRNEQDFVALLHAGADKVSVNSSAVKDPSLVDRLSAIAGAQALVVAIDVKRRPRVEGKPQEWEVYVAGGSKPTGVEGVAWAIEVARRGAGELLLTSMDRDGTLAGYDLELLEKVCGSVTIPV